MNSEINSIVRSFENTLEGEPWFGRSIYEMLDEVTEAMASQKIKPDSHSLLDLVYHMLTWADFTLARLRQDKEKDLSVFEDLDWQEIKPGTHTWKKGIVAFKSTNSQIIKILKSKTDSFLDEKVDYRNYNYRFLVNGMIQHNIYHIGQIAYLKKLL